MSLGAVQAGSAAGSYGLAKTNAQAGWENADASFAQKLWNGSRESDSPQTRQAASDANNADWQRKLSGSGTAKAREAAENTTSAKASGQTARDAQTAEKNAATAGASAQTTRDAQTAEKDAATAGASAQTAVEDTAKEEAGTTLDYQKFFQEKINEIFVKVLNGDTEPSYQIGSRSFTEKDWKKFLQKFDSVQDAIRKLMREEHAKREGKKLKNRQTFSVSKSKACAAGQNMVTAATVPESDNSTATGAGNSTVSESDQSTAAGTASSTVSESDQNTAAGTDKYAVPETGKNTTAAADQSSLLLTHYTTCVYPAAEAAKEDTRYITWYTKEGIFCRKMGQTEEMEWSISFKDPQQYDKVMELTGQFPKDWNLRFAAHENFWTDFLNGDIDTERFVEFMNGTNQGIPDYTITKDGSTYIDRDKIQWAKYFNSFGNRLYTAEEFQKKWETEIAANAAKKTRILNPYDSTADDSIYANGQLYCEYPGGPLYTAAEMAKRMWENYLLTEGILI